MFKSFLFLSVVGVVIFPTASFANVPPALYTNDNYESSTHEKPLSFSVDMMGNVVGVTEEGKTFTQQTINTAAGVRIQKFTIDDAYFYISDKGTIYAETDLEALSIYLTRVT